MKEISSAIISVMKEIDGVAKSMTVWSGASAYKGVSDKDVREVIRESMIKNGLCIMPIGVSSKIQIDRWEEDDNYGKIKSKQSCFTEVETKYILLHTSGESLELCGYGQGVDTQDKGAGKATTYALKNTLLNMFLIPTWVDTDNTHSDDLETPPVKKYQEESTDKPWYNDTEKNLDAWQDLIAEGKATPQSIIDTIESKFRLSKASKDKILKLF